MDLSPHRRGKCNFLLGLQIRMQLPHHILCVLQLTTYLFLFLCRLLLRLLLRCLPGLLHGFLLGILLGLLLGRNKHRNTLSLLLQLSQYLSGQFRALMCMVII